MQCTELHRSCTAAVLTSFIGIMKALIPFILIAYQLVVAKYKQTYLVRSSNSDPSVCDCKDVPLHNGCDTLTNFIRNASVYFVSNTYFLFLTGVHYMEPNTSLQVENIEHICLSGSIANETPVIQCISDGGFSFDNITNLTLEWLTISECGSGYFGYQHSTRAALRISTVWSLTLLYVTIQNSQGYGLSMYQLYRDGNISNCIFQCNSGTSEYSGGNAELMFPCHSTQSSTTWSTLIINSSKFLHGNFSNANSAQVASGLVIYLCSSVDIKIENVIMNGNYAVKSNHFQNSNSSGGNLALIYSNKADYFNGTVVIKNSQFVNGAAGFGAGLYVNSTSIGVSSSLQISNCLFENNHAVLDGGAVYYQISHGNTRCHGDDSGAYVEFVNCNFSQNTVESTQDAGVGVAVSIINTFISHVFHMYTTLTAQFTNCDFIRNWLLPNKNKLFSSTGAVFYASEQLGETLLADCLFEDNNASAISAIRAYITFRGEVMIRNNTGINGGGIILCEASFMILDQNTTIVIENNIAGQFGGGIYVDRAFSQSHPLCFFQFDLEFKDPESSVGNQILNTIRVDLINNTAYDAGSQLYGGSIDHCYTSLLHTGFDDYFYVETNSFDLSPIASHPQSVCFCSSNLKHNCTYEHTNTDPIYSGEPFHVYMTIVGQRNGLVPGRIHLYGLHNSSFVQNRYLKKAQCTELKYKLYSLQNEEVVVLTADSPYNTLMLGTHAKYLHVQIKGCPLGLEATESNTVCHCLPVLEHHGIVCSHQTVHRVQPVWIGYHFANKSTVKNTIDGIIFHKKCPEDYCTSKSVHIQTSNSLFDQNAQCAYNRSGLLCGTCEHNLTSVVGSSRCKDCSMYGIALSLSLILAIALGGIFLVAVLFVCNFTVTEGTMSGLIFYATIFAIVSPVLLTNIDFHFVTNIVVAFLSWLNLDPGIEFCFYHSLTEYHKMWGHFIFPVYLWTISGCIVLLCEKYTWAACLVGKNAVPVLATILLLSYAKINQGVIYALSYTTVEYPAANDTTISVTVWMMDPTVTYLVGKHIPLFIAGVIFGILSLLYTIMILFVRPLQKVSHHKCFNWVNKLKPLIDAYSCPHIIDEQKQFWNGLLLLVRGMLYVVFTLCGNDWASFLLTMTIVCCSMLCMLSWSLGGVYKKRYLNFLSSSYLLNLIIVSTVALFFQNKDFGRKGVDRDTYIAICSNISVFIAIVTFLGITLLHSYKLAKCIDITGKISSCVSRFLGVNILGHQSGYQRLPDIVSNMSSEEEDFSTNHAEFDYREPQLADLDTV